MAPPRAERSEYSRPGSSGSRLIENIVRELEPVQTDAGWLRIVANMRVVSEDRRQVVERVVPDIHIGNAIPSRKKRYEDVGIQTSDQVWNRELDRAGVDRRHLIHVRRVVVRQPNPIAGVHRVAPPHC